MLVVGPPRMTIPGGMGMGGVEAAQRILSLAPQAALIVSSGYSEDPVMADYRNYGFRAAIEKSYKVEGFLRVVSEIR